MAGSTKRCFQVMASLISEYSIMGYVSERSGSVLPGIAPSNGGA